MFSMYWIVKQAVWAVSIFYDVSCQQLGARTFRLMKSMSVAIVLCFLFLAACGWRMHSWIKCFIRETRRVCLVKFCILRSCDFMQMFLCCSFKWTYFWALFWEMVVCTPDVFCQFCCYKIITSCVITTISRLHVYIFIEWHIMRPNAGCSMLKCKLTDWTHCSSNVEQLACTWVETVKNKWLANQHADTVSSTKQDLCATIWHKPCRFNCCGLQVKPNSPDTFLNANQNTNMQLNRTNLGCMRNLNKYIWRSDMQLRSVVTKTCRCVYMQSDA